MAAPKRRLSAKPTKREGGVVRAGQRATLNGKPVVADGKGNWRRWNPLANSMTSGTVVGKYKPGVVRKPTSKTKTQPPKKTSPTPKTDRLDRDERRARQQEQAAASRSTRSSSSSSSSSSRSSGSSTKARKPQSKNMDENYRAWAKANPELAKKVKKGQAGYKAINNKPKPSSSTTASKPKPKQKPKSQANSRLSGTLSGTRGLASKTNSPSSKASPKTKTNASSRLSGLMAGTRGLRAKTKKNKNR